MRVMFEFRTFKKIEVKLIYQNIINVFFKPIMGQLHMELIKKKIKQHFQVLLLKYSQPLTFNLTQCIYVHMFVDST